MSRIILIIPLLATLAVAHSCLFIKRPFVFPQEKKVLSQRADDKALEVHTHTLATQFFPRDWKHPENLDLAAEYIYKEFARTNNRVSMQNYTVQGKEYRNVVSEYGTASKMGTVVIGAHYDACEEFPAADDNASGVAGLLELGRLIAQENLPFKVLLVAYTLEEPPFFRSSSMGSAVHAASLRKSGENVKLMISLEMIGYFSDLPDSQNYPISSLKLLYPTTGNFVAVVGSASFSAATIDIKKAFMQSVDLPVRTINAPAFIPGIDFSDHSKYWEEGFDAVMITDTAFLRNLAYHTPQDTPDRLNYKKMAEVVTGVYAYLINLKER